MKNDTHKGIFGKVRLPISQGYLYPGKHPADKRDRLLAYGLLAAVVLVVLFSLVAWLRGPSLVTRGPLSSAHATLSQDCAACHSGFDAVADQNCASCHEKVGDDLGTFSFASHYLYRSDDFQRLVPHEHEMPCASCHTEHGGRDAQLTQVRDAQCIVCHDAGRFANNAGGGGHPQFDFAVENRPDDTNLSFPHIRHVREVMKEQQLVDVEVSCLYCHNPQPDGRNFQSIDFDRHCDACHLDTGVATPRLPVGTAALAGDDPPGVETLATIRARGGPDAEWLRYASESEFRQAGSRVTKTTLHHEDPWILYNLRQLRRQLYVDGGLADLLKASTATPDGDQHVLYEEAIDALEAQAAGLRDRPEPEIQTELARVDVLLRNLRRALRDPFTPLDETEFLLALAEPNPALSAERTAELNQVAADLTQPCRNCHQLDRATIARVQKDQRRLRRAEFNHRAHIVQRRCLDCHTEIPILEALEQIPPTAETVPEEFASRDGAQITNLPHIETCRECHRPSTVASSCTTCHLFHPDKSRQSNLLLYLN